MILPSKVRFIDKKVKRAFEDLKNSNEAWLYKFLERAFKDLEKNAFDGIQMPKNLIPKSYIQKYNIDNLWKYDLPRGWRLIYFITRDEIIVLSVILEWMNHKDYEKRFSY